MSNWGGHAGDLIQVHIPFQCAAIGPTSAYASAYVGHIDDSQKQWLLSSKSPLIGDFQPPLIIRPAYLAGAPLEILLFRRIPPFVPPARAPYRRGLTAAQVIMLPDDHGSSGNSLGNMVVEGRATVTVAINNGTGGSVYVAPKWTMAPHSVTGGPNMSVLGGGYDTRRTDTIVNGETKILYYNVPKGVTHLILWDVANNVEFAPSGATILFCAED